MPKRKAGSLVLLGVILAYFIDSHFIFLSGFVGVGLTLTGATGFCGMAEILARMPWNKATALMSQGKC